MSVRRVFQAVLVVSALSVAATGCGGSSTDSAPRPTSSAVVSQDASSGREGTLATVSPADLCSALKQVRTTGTDKATRAATRTTLSQVYSASRLPGQMKPAEVDTATKASCPKVRTKILHATGLSTLADL